MLRKHEFLHVFNRYIIAMRFIIFEFYFRYCKIPEFTFTSHVKFILMIRSCLLISLSLISTFSFSQKFKFATENLNPDTLNRIAQDLKSAEILFNNASSYCNFEYTVSFCEEAKEIFDMSSESFLALHSILPNNIDINYGLGISLYFSSNRYKALPYLQKARCENYETNSLLLFYLAKSFQLNHQWDSAIVAYQKFIPIYFEGKIDIHITETEKDVRNLIKECEFAKSLEVNPYDAEIINMGERINTANPEYSSIVMSNDKIILYTSPRPNSSSPKKKKLYNYESIYMNYFMNDKWSLPQRVAYPINHDKENDAILSIAQDGKSILLYKEGDIFLSKYENGIWTEPDLIGGDLNTLNQEASACFSPDMKYIYFSSNRKETIGGLDIFRCKYDSSAKTCNEVENLGSAVNTPMDEDGMFMHADNKSLFFSSNGRASIGGFDIFQTEQTSTGWTIPTNLGIPLNSAEDDIFFSLNESKTKGYFTSYRPDGYGNKDIYMVKFPLPLGGFLDTASYDSVKLALEEIHKHRTSIALKGYIEDNFTKKGCSASIQIVNLELKDTFRIKADTAGKFTTYLESTFEYEFLVAAEKYHDKKEKIYVPGGTEVYEYSTSLSPTSNWVFSSSDDKESDLYEDSVLVEGFVTDFIENTEIDAEIVFESNGEIIPATMSPASKKFSVSLPKGKEYKATIKSDKYFHQSFSMNTASASNYSFIEAKMLKESESFLQEAIEEPLITEEKSNLAHLTAKINAQDSSLLNGIVVVTDLLTGEIVLEDSIKGEACKRFKVVVPSNRKYSVSIKADGYFHQSQEILIANVSTLATIESVLEKIEKKEKRILLTPITFETNVFGITEKNKHIVDAVVQTVASKDVKSLEIVGHTDNVGSEDANLALSQKRAESIAEYFIEKNIISKAQAVPIGKGESEPIADNATDEGKSQNRRVQLILTYLE